MSDIPDVPADLERLLDYLKSSRGFDFTAYKRTSLSRRIEKRMQVVGVTTYDAYQDILEVRQDEFQHLFNTILINVTSFFRDQETWAYIATSAVPTLLAAKSPEASIRVWVAGCASGQEACTIAIVLAEALGIEAFRERVKIYATDLDDDALSSSRAAQYTAKEIEPIPPGLRDRYFEQTNGHFTLDRDLRRAIIYGKHDLIGDAPISRVDILLCRNTLMYFNAEAQDRILQRFHFALNDSGILVLGKAETMLTHSALFATADLKNRVFNKVSRGRARERGFMFTINPGDLRRGDGDLVRLRDATFESAPDAQLVLNSAGRLMLVNERARQLFSLSRQDLGAPIQDLDVSFRPIELRSGIEQAIGQNRVVRHSDVSWATPSDERIALDVVISPLKNEAGDIVGSSIVFEDVTFTRRLQVEVQSFRQELETAYEEVQSTNEELQTTNEELQSAVVELETTNEELQSTNEELETSNEELQSANEEMETINDELRSRSNELGRANLFLESILASLRDGVIVLDDELQVLAWNHQSEELWGLRADETLGKHLLNLDIGLPVDELRGLIRACLTSKEPQKTNVGAFNRRGRQMECAIEITPMRDTSEGGRGVIILTTCATPV